MITEIPEELDTITDERFGRIAQLEQLRHAFDTLAAEYSRALGNIPEHGSVQDALTLLSAVTTSQKSGSVRMQLGELMATVLKLAVDHAEAEGATWDQIGDAQQLPRSSAYQMQKRR